MFAYTSDGTMKSLSRDSSSAFRITITSLAMSLPPRPGQVEDVGRRARAAQAVRLLAAVVVRVALQAVGPHAAGRGVVALRAHVERRHQHVARPRALLRDVAGGAGHHAVRLVVD